MKNRINLINTLGLLSVIFTFQTIQVSAQTNLDALRLPAREMLAEKQNLLTERMAALRTTNDFLPQNPKMRPDSPEKAAARQELHARLRKIHEEFAKEKNAMMSILLSPRPEAEAAAIKQLLQAKRHAELNQTIPADQIKAQFPIHEFVQTLPSTQKKIEAKRQLFETSRAALRKRSQEYQKFSAEWWPKEVAEDERIRQETRVQETQAKRQQFVPYSGPIR